ncbi:polysaccharide deacetylase family protein [Peribacillus sp. NPDC097675]|uniref:polysaccharide deacetylase family protein n=1 Tax=Peribacillus sp. NPDC097675 TaxID=3390618 RepID=UPI003D05B6B2
MLKPIIITLTLLTFLCFVHSIGANAATQSRENYESTGNVIWEVKTHQKIVAITFDDGPHPDYTPQILDLLAKYDAKATFFVAGNKVKSYPDVLKREVNEGHEIANHTYTHPYDRNISANKLSSELDNTDKIIKNLSGYRPSLYRPVGGLHNDTIINTAVNKGFKVVLWSWHQDPKDWAMPPASKISNHIIKALQPGDIILLHDWSDRPQTVQALETTLDYLYKNGYECVTVSELLYRSHLKFPEFLMDIPVQ